MGKRILVRVKELDKLIDYNHKDESKHYEETDEKDRKGHIFEAIEFLRKTHEPSENTLIKYVLEVVHAWNDEEVKSNGVESISAEDRFQESLGLFIERLIEKAE